VPINAFLEEVAKQRKELEELIRLRYKSKFSIFPFSLMRHERRMFGSRIIEERRNQSISHPKKSAFREISPSKLDEKKETKNADTFTGRKITKSKTIHDTSNVAKEIGPKIKDESNIKFVDDDNDSVSKKESNSSSSSESGETNKEKSSMNFSDSESQESSQINEDEDNSNKDKKIMNNINNIKVINPNNIKDKIDNDKIIRTNVKKSSLKNKNENNNIINFNNLNINNDNTQTNINAKNNYINNNININLINNNYLDSALKNSFLNNNIINNNYNININ
jgi:hypothetical protein